jgi:hypothetical protein
MTRKSLKNTLNRVNGTQTARVSAVVSPVARLRKLRGGERFLLQFAKDRLEIPSARFISSELNEWLHASKARPEWITWLRRFQLR